MAIDKKQRLVPGSMYIPPTPAGSTSGAISPSSAATSHSVAKSSSSPRLTAGNSSAVVSAATAKALTPSKPLGELLQSIEPRFRFQPAVEELLLDMATDFVEDVVSFSSRLAKHRRSTELQAKDLQFCLAKNYGISLAGVSASVSGSAPLNPLGSDVQVRARPAKSSLHMHRMALKRKTIQRTSAKTKKSAGLKAGDAAGTKKILHRKNSTVGLADAK